MNKFSVKVPASTSNLGPGFDAVGLAMNLYNEYSFEPIEDSSEKFIYSTNLEQGQVPENKENLVYRAFEYLFKKESKAIPSIKVHFEAGIPTSGGFGSSSTAIVGGLFAANKILGDKYTQEQLLKIGTQLDGHPDNISPAILGGLVTCVYADSELNYIKFDWDHKLSFVVVVPDFKVPTAKARSVLPAKVNFQDAVHNIGYSSLLIAALAEKNTDVLKKCFKDKLHQQYRASLVPGMRCVLDVGKEAGAIGTMLSGAGSALIAVVDDKAIAETVASAMQTAWLQSGVKSKCMFLNAVDQGAEILPN